jgi:hypothetical protein
MRIFIGVHGSTYRIIYIKYSVPNTLNYSIDRNISSGNLGLNSISN